MSNLHNSNSIFFNKEAFENLNIFIDEQDISSIFVLVDDNTQKYCLDILKQKLSSGFKVISILPGEQYKTLDTCAFIWEKLSDKGADRKSLLINLGGGVVTDIGGFAASCFRRGISFIHIPTTLLCMVDAAIGGKNGVDFKHLKNQIGIIRPPKMILIDKDFLKTLPQEQIVSGFAEILKHGLIYSKSKTYFDDCLSVDKLDFQNVKHLIDESINIKLQIVDKDVDEQGLRKVLNYGHTLGHAIESYRMGLEASKHLLHGEAIAVGLILETYISQKLLGFPESQLNQLKSFIHQYFPFQKFDKNDQSQIIELMKYDKKNTKNQINFVLLKKIGEPVLDQQVENDLIFEAFKFYQEKI